MSIASVTATLTAQNTMRRQRRLDSQVIQWTLKLNLQRSRLTESNGLPVGAITCVETVSIPK